MKTRTRTRRAPAPKKTSGATWNVRSLDTARLVELDELGAIETTDVRGAWVKVRPRIKPSERDGIDLVEVRQRLEARGARVVIWDPVVVAESWTEEDDEPLPDDVDLREAIRNWMARQTGVNETVREEALNVCLRLAEEEGI